MEPPKITERATCTQTFYTTAPPQLRLHSNKQTKAIPRTNRRRANYRNHCRAADIAPTIIIATKVLPPQPLQTIDPACRCRALRRSPQERNDTPKRRHRPITRSRVTPREAIMVGPMPRGRGGAALHGAHKRPTSGTRAHHITPATTTEQAHHRQSDHTHLTEANDGRTATKASRYVDAQPKQDNWTRHELPRVPSTTPEMQGGGPPEAMDHHGSPQIGRAHV